MCRNYENTYFSDIEYKHRRAEFNIVIGEKEKRGKGYGTGVTKLMLDYAFDIDEIHNVFLRVYEYNKGAVRSYEKAGFVQCGHRREAQFYGGRNWDIIFMEALSTEL